MLDNPESILAQHQLNVFSEASGHLTDGPQRPLIPERTLALLLLQSLRKFTHNFRSNYALRPCDSWFTA
jgi:hypothetical protein